MRREGNTYTDFVQRFWHVIFIPTILNSQHTVVFSVTIMVVENVCHRVRNIPLTHVFALNKIGDIIKLCSKRVIFNEKANA